MRPQDPRDAIRRYEEAKSIRSPYEHDWRMASAYVLPRQYKTWQTVGPGVVNAGNGSGTERFAYDSTGVRSLPKWVAIVERLITPSGMRWQKLKATNTDLMKSWAVRKYFDEVTEKIFAMRYAARARYIQCTAETYTALGVYGAGPASLMWRKPNAVDRRGGFSYKAWPLRDIFVLADDEGNVDTWFRRFYLNARQFKIKFPEATPPTVVQAELSKAGNGPSETRFFEFVHCVHPRTDYDDKSITFRRMPFTSYHISVQDAEYIGDEAGYLASPYFLPRAATEAGDLYGYSPAMQAMPALGGVSQIKKSIIKQAHKAVEPAYLANDDGVLSGRLDTRPNAVNYGGVDGQGRLLVRRMETGDFNVAENMLADDRRDIEDSFLVTLFQILQETPEMTATEVVERITEKASLLSPTMGRLQSEWVGPETERAVALMAENGELPPMPPELIEAQGEYSIQYTSPMAKGMSAEEISGFVRTAEMAAGYAQATGSPEPLDWLDFDAAMPEIADKLSARTAWIRAPEAVAAIREQRAQQMQQQQVMDQAPALASVATTAMKQQQGATTRGR